MGYPCGPLPEFATQTMLVVRFTVPGLHHWPDAPERRAYLRSAHRHLFHIEAQVEALHDDREIEFHDLLDLVQSFVPGGDFGARSCEQIARSLLRTIALAYPGRRAIVGVFEDGEVGAYVTTVEIRQ